MINLTGERNIARALRNEGVDIDDKLGIIYTSKIGDEDVSLFFEVGNLHGMCPDHIKLHFWCRYNVNKDFIDKSGRKSGILHTLARYFGHEEINERIIDKFEVYTKPEEFYDAMCTVFDVEDLEENTLKQKPCKNLFRLEEPMGFLQEIINFNGKVFR